MGRRRPRHVLQGLPQLLNGRRDAAGVEIEPAVIVYQREGRDGGDSKRTGDAGKSDGEVGDEVGQKLALHGEDAIDGAPRPGKRASIGS